MVGDGVQSRFRCIPWSVLVSLYSYGLCLFLTPPVNSPSNNSPVIGAVATATAANCVQQHVARRRVACVPPLVLGGAFERTGRRFEGDVGGGVDSGAAGRLMRARRTGTCFSSDALSFD